MANKTPSTGLRVGAEAQAKAPTKFPSNIFYRKKTMTTKRAMNKIIKNVVEYENTKHNYKIRIEQKHFFLIDGVECIGLAIEDCKVLPYKDICLLGMHLGLNFYALQAWGGKKRILFSNNDNRLLKAATEVTWVELED